jgi:hypothetical protein
MDDPSVASSHRFGRPWGGPSWRRRRTEDTKPSPNSARSGQKAPAVRRSAGTSLVPARSRRTVFRRGSIPQCTTHTTPKETTFINGVARPIVGAAALMKLARWCRQHRVSVSGGDPCQPSRMDQFPPSLAGLGAASAAETTLECSARTGQATNPAIAVTGVGSPADPVPIDNGTGHPTLPGTGGGA